MEIGKVKQYILDNEQEYTYHFNEFPNFRAFFMHKIHVGVQKFLHSCANRNKQDINLKEIDYSPFLESIQERELYFIWSPPWLKKRLFPTQKQVGVQQQPTNTPIETPKKEEGQPEAKKLRTGGKTVQNDNKDPISRPAVDYTFGTVFSQFHRNGFE